MNQRFILLPLLLFFICTSCDNNRHVRYYRVQKEAIKPTVISQPSAPSSINWNTPTHWVSTKGSSMRIGSFDVPFADGIGDISVIKLGGAAGGLAPNINRWRGQLNLKPHSEIEIQQYVKNEESQLGTFQWFTIINPEENETAFLASIFQIEAHTIFVKLSATTHGISQLESQFLDFCKSFTSGATQ